jgi:hypothetical protein
MAQKANSDYTIRTEGRIAIKREHDKYGDGTGAAYYACECGAELVTSFNKANIPHRNGCPEGGQ